MGVSNFFSVYKGALRLHERVWFRYKGKHEWTRGCSKGVWNIRARWIRCKSALIS